MTNNSGAVVWKTDYRPFGEEQLISPNTIENNERFAGKEKDKETGMLYFGARYLGPKTGHFITVDPVGAVDEKTGKANAKMLVNPQRLNRYAYALNNPYRYIDSNGEMATEAGFVFGTVIAPGPGTILGTAIGGIVDAGLGLTGAYIAYKAGEAIYNAASKNEGADAKKDPKKGIRAKDLPGSAEPNSTAVKDSGDGRGQIREYGPDGRAKVDHDFGHDHGAGDPHAHDWNWSKTPPRQEGRPLNPGE